MNYLTQSQGKELKKLHVECARIAQLAAEGFMSKTDKNTYELNMKKIVGLMSSDNEQELADRAAKAATALHKLTNKDI